MEQKFRVVKRSIDARQKQLKVHLTVLTDEQGAPLPKDAPNLAEVWTGSGAEVRRECRDCTDADSQGFGGCDRSDKRSETGHGDS